MVQEGQFCPCPELCYPRFPRTNEDGPILENGFVRCLEGHLFHADCYKICPHRHARDRARGIWPTMNLGTRAELGNEETSTEVDASAQRKRPRLASSIPLLKETPVQEPQDNDYVASELGGPSTRPFLATRSTAPNNIGRGEDEGETSGNAHFSGTRHFSGPYDLNPLKIMLLLSLLFACANGLSVDLCDCSEPRVVGTVQLGQFKNCKLEAETTNSERVNYTVFQKPNSGKVFKGYICKMWSRMKKIEFLLGGDGYHQP